MRKVILSLLIIPAFSCTLSLNAQTPGTTGSITGTDGITYTTVVAKDSLIWTRQSLGAVRVATSFDDSNAYGDLYQWGRWRDGHQTRNPDNIANVQASPNDPRGYNSQSGNPFYTVWWWNASAGGWYWTAAAPADIDSATGCDPCKQILDSTWHLPTYQEWFYLFTREGITSAATAFSSNLKIAAGGLRTSQGQKSGAGTNARFWTSTVCNNFGNGTQTGYQVNIGDNSAHVTGCMSVGTGMPVRCVKAVSPATGIKAVSGYGSLRIYPNPASGSVTVGNIPDGSAIRITDITGKTVYSAARAEATERINTAGFASGVYSIQIINNGAVFNRKLVVSK